MSLRSGFWSALEWLRALGKNVYFWGGIVVLIGLGFGAYLVVDAVIMPSYTRHDVSIQVPNVEDRPFEEAKAQLKEQNLKVEREVGRYNPNVAQGIVVDQTPLPNSKVKPGRRIYLTVNAGEVPTVKMPDLKGMSVREAKNRISSLDLEVGEVKEDSIPSPYANTITNQKPAPGDSLKKGESVTLWYSTGLGDSEVEVPNVVGYTVKDARDFLLRKKLRSVVVDTNLTTQKDKAGQRNEGTDEAPSASALYVRKQGRPPGTSVRTGTEIRLFTTKNASEALKRREALEDDTTTSSSD